MSDPNESHLLGRIDGKLDQVIKALDRHIDDDVRRFTEVYKKQGEHDQEIAKAKGGKAVLLWVVGGGAAAVASFVTMAAKGLGLK